MAVEVRGEEVEGVAVAAVERGAVDEAAALQVRVRVRDRVRSRRECVSACLRVCASGPACRKVDVR